MRSTTTESTRVDANINLGEKELRNLHTTQTASPAPCDVCRRLCLGRFRCDRGYVGRIEQYDINGVLQSTKEGLRQAHRDGFERYLQRGETYLRDSR
jgi:hypothetical protein